MRTLDEADVVVIGGGVAGTSAATTLIAAGCKVRLVDKASRPGGRCATRRATIDAGSAWYDYGAQYFTAREAAFRDVVDADLAAGHLERWQPSIHLAERSDARWRLTPSPDQRERLIAPTGLNHWVRHRLAQAGADVLGSARVVGIRPAAEGWDVEVEDAAERIHAGALIVTTPAVQSAALLADLPFRIAALADAAHAMRACHSLVVKAPGLTDCHGIFVHGGTLSWIADNSHKAHNMGTARHLWTLHASPEFSDAHLEDAPRAVEQILLDEFSEISGLAAGDIATVRGHRWRYARPGEGAPDPERLCHIDRNRRLALAGDWLAGGRVEGAWLSGRAAALALLA